MSDVIVTGTTAYTALLSGNYWNGIEVTGSPVIVTYSFPTTAPAYLSAVQGFTSATAMTFTPFTAAEQAEAIGALGQWASASGLIFIEVAPGQGDINFQNVDFNTTTYAGDGGVGFYPFGNYDADSYPYFTTEIGYSGDVFMNSDFINVNGTYGITPAGTVSPDTMLHEIGHAIGLKHPDEIVTDNAADPVVVHNQELAPDAQGNADETIMAETGDTSIPGGATTLFPLDMQAAAAIYGPAGPGEVVSVTGGIVTGADSVSAWSWNATTQTLTQTAAQANDTIRGTSVNDIIYAGDGTDEVFGLDGNNILYAGTGNDSLFGGLGADTMVGSSGNDVFYSGGGTELMQSGNGYATFYGGAGSDTMLGAGVIDVFYAGSGTEFMQGGPDVNYFYGSTGAETMIGGAGFDYYFVNSTATVITQGSVDGESAVYASVDFQLPANIQELALTASDVTGQANSGYDSLFGGTNDSTVLIGGAGGDYMVGGTSNSTLIAGTGTDLMFGQSGNTDFVFRSPQDAQPGANPTYIGNFTQGQDKIDLSAMQAGHPMSFIGSAPFTGVAGQVDYTQSGGDTFVEGDLTGAGTADFEIELYGTIALTASDLILSTACYCAGTRILTDHGEIPIENLTIGDHVVTRSGEKRPLRWIGRRSYDGRLAAANPHALPIRIGAGAIADDVPKRDLYVSPTHALFLDGVLIPAAALVNDASILQLHDVDQVRYIHLELDAHDVIIAEGVEAETYVDDDNRAMFQNAQEFVTLYPLNARRPARYCAPRLEQGPQVDAVWTRLANRAAALGHDMPRFHSSNLETVGTTRIEVPAHITELHLLSPHGRVPGDRRQLGALLIRVSIDDRAIALSDARLLRGFHGIERHGDHLVRWTGGAGVIAIDQSPSPQIVEIEIAVLMGLRIANAV
jgi:Ca2+-binding RTX toxin-like protein